MTETTTESPKRGRPKSSVNRLENDKAQETETKPMVPPPAPAPADRPQREAARQPTREHVPAGRTVVTGRDGEQIWRRRNNMDDQFHIPEELKEDGWDYQWNRISVLGQEDSSTIINDRENGWRPIMADRPGFAGRFMPAGHKGPIEREGLQLCERPMALTMEARAEDHANAVQQKNTNRRDFGLKEVPEGFDAHHHRLAAMGKGGAPGVDVSIEGALPSDGKYRYDIDAADA